jgi:hypothetical protein
MEAQQLDFAWRTSRWSVSNGACVEVAHGKSKVLVRDSKNQDGPVLGFRGESWRSFVARTKIRDLALTATELTSKDARGAA